MKYKLFQVKSNLTRTYGFVGLSLLIEHGGGVNLDNYDLVYEGTINETNKVAILNDLYYLFNQERPEDFTGRSMSVSDIIQLGNEYYYCDSFGWEKVEI